MTLAKIISVALLIAGITAVANSAADAARETIESHRAAQESTLSSLAAIR